MDSDPPYRRQRRRSATRAATLLERTIRQVGESRGFAVAKVLTQWDEIAGPEIAALARPVRVSYGRGGMAPTLILLTSGANAPIVQMQSERLRERVNACYGYNAVSRIRIVQTAPEGVFGAPDRPARSPRRLPEPDPVSRQDAAEIADPDLRAALERLGTAIRATRRKDRTP